MCAEDCSKCFTSMISFYRYDSSVQQVSVFLSFTDEETEVEGRYAQQSRIYSLSLIHCTVTKAIVDFIFILVQRGLISDKCMFSSRLLNMNLTGDDVINAVKS